MLNFNPEILWQSKTGVYILRKASINTETSQEECYCITNLLNDKHAIFNLDENILASVVWKLNRTGIRIDFKSGNRFMMKFPTSGREKGVSLRLFLISKYEGIPLADVRYNGKIYLVNDGLLEHGILDLRSCNLIWSNNNINGIEVYTREKTDEKFIVITMDGRSEILDYSQELYDLITTRSLVRVGRGTTMNNRLYVAVHYKKGKGGYKVTSLSKFADIFYKYYRRVRRCRGAKKRFAKNFPVYVEEYNKLCGEQTDCGHIHAKYKNNNTFWNLLPMSKTDNMGMSDYIARFCGIYDSFAIKIYEEGKPVILVWFRNGLMRGVCLKLDSVDKYRRFQTDIQNPHGVFHHMVLLVSNSQSFQKQILVGLPTPYEEYRKYGAERTTTIGEHLDWCERRDELLTAYREQPEAFKTWHMKQDVVSTLLNVETYLCCRFSRNEPFAMIFNNGVQALYNLPDDTCNTVVEG